MKQLIEFLKNNITNLFTQIGMLLYSECYDSSNSCFMMPKNIIYTINSIVIVFLTTIFNYILTFFNKKLFCKEEKLIQTEEKLIETDFDKKDN